MLNKQLQSYVRMCKKWGRKRALRSTTPAHQTYLGVNSLGLEHVFHPSWHTQHGYTPLRAPMTGLPEEALGVAVAGMHDSLFI